MKRLLAKSYSHKNYPDAPPNYALLTQHSRDVVEACEALTSVLQIAFNNCNLPDTDFTDFCLQLKAVGWIHDWGKANLQFQEIVEKNLKCDQLLRHEIISALLILDEKQPFHNWLRQKFDERTLYRILWSVLGHHRKFSAATQAKETASTRVFLRHPDFQTIIDEMSESLGIANSPQSVGNITIALGSSETCDVSARRRINDLKDEYFPKKIKLFDPADEKKKLALLKGFTIAADVAASAVAALNKDAAQNSLTDFIESNFSAGLTENDLNLIVGKRDPYDFQKEVAASESYLTFAQAGCGSGKSVAAYLWAQKWRERFERAGRTNFRLFFCLPTTGTTTEHFRDYALESGIAAHLLHLTHSRSRVDLQTIAETATNNSNPKSQAQEVLNETRDKIESLALWSTPLVVTTTDTVLGLMTNARRAVYSLPALMNSAIVFDEIHAFDEQLFGHLLVFLKNFPKLPVLLMTASLSKQRIEALKQVRPDEIAFVPGNIEFETLKRYSIREISDLETAWQQVESCLASNGKVLWIRNRVDWANETYSQCRNRFPNIWSNVYHSRFRYKDRSRRHRRVIDVFNEEGRPAILVATQVAEMSLDLSADLLISDIALIPSLIQRMGRLNRRLKPNTPPKERKICPALIYSYPNLKQNELPYDFEQLEMAQKWVRCLQPKTALNQKDLADAFSGFENDAIFNLTQAEKNAIFFSGLWETRVGETRGEGNTTSVLLQADVEKFKREKRRDLSEWTRRHEVAIPIKNEIFKWAIFNGLRVAPPEFVKYEMDEYGEGTGAAWRK